MISNLPQYLLLHIVDMPKKVPNFSAALDESLVLHRDDIIDASLLVQRNSGILIFCPKTVVDISILN